MLWQRVVKCKEWTTPPSWFFSNFQELHTHLWRFHILALVKKDNYCIHVSSACTRMCNVSLFYHFVVTLLSLPQFPIFITERILKLQSGLLNNFRPEQVKRFDPSLLLRAAQAGNAIYWCFTRQWVSRYDLRKQTGVNSLALYTYVNPTLLYNFIESVNDFYLWTEEIRRQIQFQGHATWCLRREDLCSNDDVIFFAAKKMTSSLLHKSSPRRHHVARL